MAAGGEGEEMPLLSGPEYLARIDRKLDILIECLCPAYTRSAKSLKATARAGAGKKAKDISAPKRALAAGTASWMAFAKECKLTQPERFEKCMTEPERLKIVKHLRAEDEAAYRDFVARFKESYLTSGSGGASAGKKGAAAAPEENSSMVKIEIAGDFYWLDPGIGGLYQVGPGNSWGSWVGYYQPGDELNPIRFTSSPNAEGGGRRRKTRRAKKNRK
jgi:hypothetical protein